MSRGAELSRRIPIGYASARDAQLSMVCLAGLGVRRRSHVL